MIHNVPDLNQAMGCPILYLLLLSNKDINTPKIFLQLILKFRKCHKISKNTHHSSSEPKLRNVHLSGRQDNLLSALAFIQGASSFITRVLPEFFHWFLHLFIHCVYPFYWCLFIIYSELFKNLFFRHSRLCCFVLLCMFEWKVLYK